MMSQKAAELSFSVDIKNGKQQNNRHNAVESYDNSHDLQQGGSKPSPDVTDIKSTGKVNVNAFSEVAEQLTSYAKCVDIISTKKNDYNMNADNVLHEVRSIKTYCRRRKRVKTYYRKRRKISDSLVNSLEPNKEGPGYSLLAVHNTTFNTSFDHSDEALVSGCFENMLEREVVAGCGTLLKVLEDVLVDSPLGGCSDLEHASGESKNKIEMEKSKESIDEDSVDKDLYVAGLVGENFEQAKKAMLNFNQNAACDVYYAEEKLEESSKEDKASGDVSGQDPTSETQYEQTKLEDAFSSVSELDAVKDNDNQVINKENNPTQLLQSSLGRGPSGCFRRKLLVLDVNGLLADIVSYIPDGCAADTIIGKKAIFKRPFCDDFLQFCFERFSVGVWSSRTKRNVQLALDFLLGETKQNLLFCWDQSHCTETGFNTVEKRDKPLVLKELKKLWEKHEPNLPWERGDYNESNTLLLDDSPYKALRNPPNTAIFPHTYQYVDEQDNSLGSGGDLWVYLEGLALAENVQNYVEQNPFGQRPITKRNLSWPFYLKVIGTSSHLEDDANFSATS